jgi:hypothetical protein
MRQSGFLGRGSPEATGEERFSVEFRKGINSLKMELKADDKIQLDKILTLMLIISIVISVSAIIYVIVTPKQDEKFTEFYILGTGGKAYDYPTKIWAGNKSTVLVGVVNHEYARVNFSLRLSLNNSSILSKNLTLQKNQTWEQPVSYVLNETGDEQKLEFFLYKDGNFSAPYRDLHLRVSVSQRGPSVQGNGVQLPTSVEITPDVVKWYADQYHMSLQNSTQFQEADKRLKQHLAGGYWYVIGEGEPLTEEPGNCKQKYCLVRGIGACTVCREKG